MNISSVSFSKNGDEINKKLYNLFVKDNFFAYGKSNFLLKRDCGIYEWSRFAFENSNAVIFIGAVGICVRAVSPYIKDKVCDPAVIVIDDNGKYVIPVLSGHLGGANKLALMIADFLSATPVITTATDINNIWAVDSWAKENNCEIEDSSKIKYISSSLLNGEKVGLVSDFEIIGKLPPNVIIGKNFENGIVISCCNKKPFKNTLNIIPKIINMGVGSRKNSDENSLVELFEEIIKRENIFRQSINRISTIDIKKKENGVLKLCRELGKSLNIFTAQELSEIKGEFSSSDFVKSITGVDNVCERAALSEGGKLIVKKTKGDGVTIAFCQKDWSVCFEDNNGRN